MLFKREDVFVEVLLELLVGKVDIELLKAVHSEVFKAKDVKDTHKGKLLLCTPNPCIDLPQDPAEQAGIETH